MRVKKQRFAFGPLTLDGGQTLPEVQIGFETYGTLNPSGDNAILIAHYFSGTSHAAGRYDESDPEPGYWDAIIGPGKAIDTERYFVIASDVLSNLNALAPNVFTTGPLSVDPRSQRSYGANFPEVTIGDFVEAQRRLCAHLGVHHLHAVAGPSMGSLQAMEWTARFPEFVDRAICAIPASLEAEPHLIASLSAWRAPILLDPKRGLIEALKLVTLTAVSPAFLRRLTTNARSSAEKFSVDLLLDERAIERARLSDAESLLRLTRACQTFSIRDRLARLRAKYLFISASSDMLMLPEYARHAVRELRAQQLEAELFVLDGDGGHLDGLTEIAQASSVIRRFLKS